MSVVVAMSLLSNSFGAPNRPTTILIAPGVEMPFVNLGGVESAPSNYLDFLNSGGTGLDTALTYGDDIQIQVKQAVDKAVANGRSRNDIFVTTKVPCCPNNIWGPGEKNVHCLTPEFNGTIMDDVNRNVALLGGPADLMLLHWPCTTVDETVKAYAQLEEALAQGKTRAIGVSNFNASVLNQFLPQVKVKPAVNQCAHSIGAHNATHLPLRGGDSITAQLCKEKGISYSAYSPLGGLDGIDVFKNPTVIKIGEAHNVSAAQVALRWLVQQNISVVTAADQHDYIVEDLDLFSFELSDGEMATLSAI